MSRINHTQAGTASPIGIETAYAGRTAPTGWLLEYGQAVSRTTYSELFGIIAPTIGTFTVTIATPGVITLTGHGLISGDQVYLTTTGALPTGLTANTLYYAIYIDANTVRLATSRANAMVPTPINTTGSQSGVHTMRFCPFGLGDGSTTFNVPDRRGRVAVGADAMGGTSANRLTNPAATTGGLDGDVLGNSGGVETHALTIAQLASHTHDNYQWLFNGAGSSGAHYGYGYQTNTGALIIGTGAGETQYKNGPTGSDAAHNNVQPTLISNYIIKAL